MRALSSKPPRSPLSFVVLALLFEEPMHSYRVHKLISERGKDRVVNVGQRNSVQQALQRLDREGLVEVQEKQQDAKYPERVIYRITYSGRDALFGWLEHMLAAPATEYPQFPAALAFLALSSPDEAAALLQRRRDGLASRADEQARQLDHRPEFLPRIFVIEDEYTLAMLRAEICWLDSVLAEIKDSTLAWSPEQLLATRHERET